VSGKIAVCLNLELFHADVPSVWIDRILDHVESHTQNQYMFLTKFPVRYSSFDYSDFSWQPSNIWLGTTWDGLEHTERNIDLLALLDKNVAVRFVSFEPLLAFPYGVDLSNIDWIIIGADSRRGAEKPSLTWAEILIRQARSMGIAVWVKDNYGFYERIKEYPMVVDDGKVESCT